MIQYKYSDSDIKMIMKNLKTQISEDTSLLISNNFKSQ